MGPEEEDLSIETGGELGPDLGLGARPEDQPTPTKKKPTDVIPDVPVLDSTRENKAVSDSGPAPAPDGDDSLDSFIIHVDDQNRAKDTDKTLEMLMGLPEEPGTIPPVDPKQMGRGERIGRTVSEILYKAPVKGVRDAIQNTVNLTLELDQNLKTLTEGTSLEFLGRPPGSPPGTPLAKPGDPNTQLPDPGEMETGAGNVEKNIVQFLTGFAAAGKALEAAGVLGNLPAAANLTKGFIAMMTSFDGNDERLGNLVAALDPQGKGGLLTDVATYLKAEDDDPELLGRLKGAVEDAGAGLFVESILRSLRAFRAATKIKEVTGAPTFEQAAQKVSSQDFINQLKTENQPVDAVDNALGSSSGPMVVSPNQEFTGYHGTGSNFEQFDLSKAGSRTGTADAPGGIFFSTNPETASEYAYVNMIQPTDYVQVNEALVARLPKDVADKYKALVEEAQKIEMPDVENLSPIPTPEEQIVFDKLHENNKKIDELLKPVLVPEANVRPSKVSLQNPMVVESTATDTHAERAAIIEQAKAAGHDGVIIKNASDIRGKSNDPADVEDIIIAFKPEQIRSAFDTTSGQATAGFAPTQYRGQTVNVNFGRIDTPDDLRLAVEELKKTEVKVGAGVPIQKLTNVVAEAKTPGAQQAYDLILKERERRIKTGKSTPMAAEDQEAMKSLWVSASNKLDDVIKTARASPTPENLFAFRKMLSTFGVINNELLGVRQATSKAVNIWKKSDKVPVRRMKDIEEVLERTGGVEDNKKLLDQLGRYIDSNPDAAVAISKMSQASRRYGTVRAIRNFWTLGLLTNWKTHEVNAISNTAMMLMVAAERAGAARYSKAFAVEGGVAPGEATAMLTGMWDSLGEAMSNAGRTFRTGEGGGAFQKIELPFEHNVYENADTSLKKFVNTSMWYWGGIGRALQASDEFFKTLNMSAEVNALTLRQAHHEMLAGKLAPKDMAARITELRNDVPEEVLLKAEDTARYATFTKEPGKITKKVAAAINEIPGGRFIIPFINTPSNLFNAAIERTPFAPLQKQFRDAVRRGGADEAIAMSKLTMGMTLMGKGASDTFDGKMTGSGPPFWSPEAARWKAEGKQPYSRLINGKWVPYNRFDPMGMVLGLSADLGEKLMYMDQMDVDSLADYQNLAAGAVFSLASQMTNKSYMQGAAALFDAINNEEISAAGFVNMMAGSMVPSAVGEVARLVDPVQRQSYDFITKWKSRTPGQSSSLEPKLDMWGREQTYGTGNTLIDVLNPVNITKSNVTPIDHEFDLQGWSIPKSITEFTTDGAKISLKGRPEIANFMLKTSRATKPSEMGDSSDPAVRKLLRKYGDYSMHDLMSKIVSANHPLYRRYAKKSDGPDGSRVDMMKMIYKDYYNASKSLVMKQFPELQIEILDQESKRLQKRQDIAEERKRNPAGDTP